MLVLASNSPRRRQMMALGGWPFLVMPAEVDESVLPGEASRAYVLRLAEEKARSALERHRGQLLEEALLLASDTAVVVDGEILGKPADAAEAEWMLRRLRGRSHEVYTGIVALRVKNGVLLSDVCVTQVPMRPYSDQEIQEYIATGDPFDKAGGYAIQHAGFHPVTSLEGCYANVMGMPLCHLKRMLTIAGVSPQVDIARACQTAIQYDCPVYRYI